MTGLLVGLCVLACAGAAQATTRAHASAAAVFPFGCRASGARVELGTATLLEPIVANSATTPCHTDSAASNTIAVPTSKPILTVGPIGAFTEAAGTPTVAPAAAAVSDIQAVNIPTASGTITIVGPVEAAAGYACVNGALQSYAQSTLDVIYVNGVKMTLPAPGAADTITLANGVYIALNQQLKTANSVTERVLEVHLGSLADVVVGEATVSQSFASPCAGTTGGGTSGGGGSSGGSGGTVSGTTVSGVPSICPAGSTLDVPAKACVIYYNGKTIFVSEPFKGPTGGVVLPLAVARQRYKSACLSGPGPDFVLVATKRGGRVTGTPHADRILARGAFERVAGLAGNDCIDGSGGSQKLFDGNGNDRVYAAGGFNRVGLGNGNDYVNGRNGRDWITVGNGKSTIYGGKGNSRIDVGIGHDHVFGGPGTNNIWAAGDGARISCGSGTGNKAWVRAAAKPYAASHGCQRIIVLLH
ncbi:MAG TPA: calcium-binding protein [Solirubrobacteraceae bacterium]|nr:calcium-binding protein [Solirubrobacteraceae bacterium]